MCLLLLTATKHGLASLRSVPGEGLRWILYPIRPPPQKAEPHLHGLRCYVASGERHGQSRNQQGPIGGCGPEHPYPMC